MLNLLSIYTAVAFEICTALSVNIMSEAFTSRAARFVAHLIHRKSSNAKLMGLRLYLHLAKVCSGPIPA